VGNLLDNVVVSTPTSTVPEPSSLLLLGTGLSRSRPENYAIGCVVRPKFWNNG
jgi:hypothetical protein